MNVLERYLKKALKNERLDEVAMDIREKEIMKLRKKTKATGEKLEKKMLRKMKDLKDLMKLIDSVKDEGELRELEYRMEALAGL